MIKISMKGNLVKKKADGLNRSQVEPENEKDVEKQRYNTSVITSVIFHRVSV